MQEINKSVAPLFGSPGGKKLLAEKIVSFIPKHKIYVEPFAGGLAVFFKKEPSQLEVVNDLDPEIAFAYRFIKNITDEKIYQLLSWKLDFDRDYFFKLQREIPATPLRRFYKFIYLTYYSFNSNRRSTVLSKEGISGQINKEHFKKKILRVKKRLGDVRVYNKDYKEIVKKFDSKDTFFYLDPPYVTPPFQGVMSKIDLKELKEVLDQIKGKFILSTSIEDSKVVSKGFKKYLVKFTSSASPQKKLQREYLISNFPLKKQDIYIGKNFSFDVGYFKSMAKMTPDFIIDFAEIVKNIKGQTILDLGCGLGKGLRILKNAGYQIEGVDISDYAINYLKKRGCNVKKMDIHNLDYPDNYFDTVYASHSLEHCQDIKKAITEAIRVAKKRIILLIPLGVRFDRSHCHQFDSLQELKRIFKDFIYKKDFSINQNNVACVVIDKTEKQNEIISQFGAEIMLVPDYVSLVGSAIKNSEYNDIDYVYRSSVKWDDLEIQIRNQVDKKLAEKLHPIVNPSGAHGDYIPIYDLILRKKKELKKVTVEKKREISPLEFFKPPKTGAGYGVQEFYDIETFYNQWARPYVEAGKDLMVEPKYNGWRTIISKRGKDVLIFFRDSKKNRSVQFPDLTDEVRMIEGDVILDCDLSGVDETGKIIPRKDLADFGGDKEIGFRFETAGGIKGSLICRVFDLPYYNENIQQYPLFERKNILKELFGKYDFKILKQGEFKVVRDKHSLIREINRVRKLDGSEGAVVKVADSFYKEEVIPDWAKIKNFVELKVEVLDKYPVKGSKGTFNYLVAYKKNAQLVPLTKTMNTNLKANKGDILTISVEEIIPIKKDGEWFISVVVPVVRDKDITLKAPMTMEKIIGLGYSGNILQASNRVIEELRKENFLKRIEGQLSFKEGMRGKGILQLHERGLSESQIKYTNYFGEHPIQLSKKELEILNTIKKINWENPNEVREAVKTIKEEELTIEQKKVFAKVDPVSIHTDIRLMPEGEDWWEGGEGFTPGNQFQKNLFIEISKNPEVLYKEKILANFKVPRKGEIGEKEVGTIRGSKIWFEIGKKKPYVANPGEVGATENAYGRFKIIDEFKWEAGTQDRHYKEFWFDGKILKGRWIFTYTPIGEKGQRMWMISRPKEQIMDRDRKKKIEKFFPICKIDKKQQKVFSIVYEPLVKDAHGDWMTAEEIEKMAHNFMENLKEKKFKIMHRDDITPQVALIEAWVTKSDGEINGHKIKKGTFIVGHKIYSRELWDKIERGEINGISMGGRAEIIEEVTHEK